MKRYLYCIAVLSIGLFAACEKKSSTVSATEKTVSAPKSLEIPTVDLSTPEKAIYSYQAAQNWLYAYNWNNLNSGPVFEQISKTSDKADSVALPFYQNRVVQIFKQNNELKKQRSATKYEFTIEEMKKETDTRVVAMVKVHNITPIPAGVEPDETVSKWRKEGKSFKIVLELENARWLISDILEYSDYPKEWKSQISNTKQYADWLISLP